MSVGSSLSQITNKVEQREVSTTPKTPPNKRLDGSYAKLPQLFDGY
jgi:hypothetical protein